MDETAEHFIERQGRRWQTERERGQVRRFKDIGRRGWHLWYREAWTFRVQSNYSHKVLVIERLRRGAFEGTPLFDEGAKEGDIEYRFGYFTRTRKGNWGWGQYAQMVPHFDFIELLAQARAEGTILDLGGPWHR